jgi:RNA polymerase sigma-70 factor (ECF subfamily)
MPLRQLTPSPAGACDARRRDVILEETTMSTSTPPNDHAAPAGLSPAAVEVLISNHARFLAFLERRVGSRAVAEDILQDAFVRGLSRGAGARLRADESAIAWFYRLLRNAIVDRARHAATETRTRAAAAAEEASSEAPDRELEEVVCGCVRSLVETLAEPHQRALRSVDLGGASVRDYAVGEGITPGNAAVRLHRARQALRRRVEESCGTCATHGCYQCECRSESHAG